MPYSSLSSPNYTPLDSKEIKSIKNHAAKPQSKSGGPLKLLLPVSMVAFVLSISAFTGLTLFQYVNQNSVKSKATFEQPNAKAMSQKETDNEKIILASESAKLGIDVNINEILTRIKAMNISVTKDEKLADSLVTSIGNDILREKIVLNQIDSVSVYSIGFWIPPESSMAQYSGSEKQITEQIQQSQKALSEIKQMLQSNQLPSAIVKIIIKKYPALKNILAVNTKRIIDNPSDESLDDPATYDSSSADMNHPFYKTIFSMHDNDIQIIPEPEITNRGGRVVKVIHRNKSNIKTYEEWLKNKLKEYNLSN